MKKLIILTISLLLFTGLSHADEEMNVYGHNTVWRHLIGKYNTIEEANIVYDALKSPKNCSVFTDRLANDSVIGYSIRCAQKPNIAHFNNLNGSGLVYEWR